MKLKIFSTVVFSVLAIATTGCAYNGNVEHHYDRQEYIQRNSDVDTEQYQFYRGDFSNCEPNGKFRIRIHH